VHFEILDPKLIYRNDLDLVGLARIGDTFERAPEGNVVLGITIRSDQLNMRVGTRTMALPDGRQCVWATTVEAWIGNPELDVYVAANYVPGTCEHSVVLQHENQHVAIDRGVVRAYGPRIGAALRDIVRRSFPMVTTDPKLTDRLPDWLMQSLRPLIDAMDADLERRNGALDTPENYRRTAALCQNWFPPGTRMPGR
jgi:hypothetical protein